jgi:hypothetical protein
MTKRDIILYFVIIFGITIIICGIIWNIKISIYSYIVLVFAYIILLIFDLNNNKFSKWLDK